MSKPTILFEDMPPAAQKSYNFTNKLRKGAMFVGLAAYSIILITYIVGTIMYKQFEKNESLGMAWAAVLVGAVIVSWVPGAIHSQFWFKKAFKSCTFILPIGFFVGCAAALFVGGMFAYVSPVFVIIDTVLFIKKKPLVYNWEHKYFLESKQAQAEMEAAAYNAVLNSFNSDDAMIKLQQLKEMMEQGVITEEEFNAKKAELLDKI